MMLKICGGGSSLLRCDSVEVGAACERGTSGDTRTAIHAPRPHHVVSMGAIGELEVIYHRSRIIMASLPYAYSRVILLMMILHCHLIRT